MNQILETKLQYYPAHVNSKKPIGVVTLDYFLRAVMMPSDKIRRIFRLIGIAESYGNMKRKATLKQNNLYYFTPCVFTDGHGRGYKNIVRFTGLAVLDFDHIENAEEFKNYIWEKYKFILAAFVSPSKKGVKCLVKIPVVDTVEEFKSYYYGIGTVLDKYKGWDGVNQNAVLPLFLSMDEDILIREDSELFDKKGSKEDFFTSKNVVAPVEIEATDKDKKRIFENAKKAIDSIVDNGHPQLIAASISLGGYVASGYIEFHEAESFVHSLIESSGYLRKGISGYKKTATSAINKGMEKGLTL